MSTPLPRGADGPQPQAGPAAGKGPGQGPGPGPRSRAADEDPRARSADEDSGARVRSSLRSTVRALRQDLFTVEARPLPPSERRGPGRWLAHGVFLASSVLFAAVGSAVLSNSYLLDGGFGGGLALTHAAAIVLALRRPVPAWWLSIAVFLLTAQTLMMPQRQGLPWPWTVPGLFVQCIVLLLVALRVPLRATVEMTLVTVALTLLLGSFRGENGGSAYSSDVSLAVVLFMAVAVVGGSVRARKEARRRLVRQETLTAEERARRTLLEERTRIARELHDVVAHHMSVIAIQAEAAPYRVQDPPPELTRSFSIIRDNAVEALTELRRVLGVLRSEEAGTGGTPGTGEDGAGSPKVPQPTLARLDELVANVRAAGLSTDVEVAGVPRPLPQGVELSAFRIVQEALSNALRHAPGSDVRVTVGYEPGGVRLRVVNGPGLRPHENAAPAASPGTGHGVLGMSERAAMLGGGLVTGPTPDGGFAVSAFLPALETPASAATDERNGSGGR